MVEKKVKTFTNEEILDIVQTEGLGYALTGYLGPSNGGFEDKRLGELWDKAHDALYELESYLDTWDFLG